MSDTVYLSPYERARKVYETESCARTFEEDLDMHLAFGYVFSTPRLFLMGRPVRMGAPRAEVARPDYGFVDADAWFIYLAAGELEEFFKFEPYPLPYYGWERNNVVRWYDRKQVRRLCGKTNLLTFSGGQ